jgi:SAM-dependent methyltransferase
MKVVFDIDDLTDQHDPYEELIALKEQIPNLKVTLFAIPSGVSEETRLKYAQHEWVELGVHGYHHSNIECMIWTEEEAIDKITEGHEKLKSVKVFKAPGWLAHHAVYDAINKMGWAIADNINHVMLWIQHPDVAKVKRYVLNAQFEHETIHGHTWDTMDNGPEWWKEEALKYKDEEFDFVSDVARIYDVDVVQETCNSWSHTSAFGQRSRKHLGTMIRRLKPEGKILDAGGNDGFAAAGHPKYNITVADNSPFRAGFAKNILNVPAVCSPLEKLPFEDEEFEWVFCSHTLEHVKDLNEALSEIMRVSEKGVWIVVPIEPEQDLNNPSHLRWGDKEQWLEWLGDDAELMYESDEEMHCVVKK